MTTDDTALDSHDIETPPITDLDNDAVEESTETSSASSADEPFADQSAEQITETAPSIPAELRVPLLQALLISFGDPLAIDQLTETTSLTADEVRAALAELRELLALPTSGIELVEVGARFQIRTKVAFSPYIRTLKAERPRRLSGPALETLAIVAYQQPVPKSDIDKLRGVDSTPTLKTLLERGLVRVVGQAASVGHPSLYGTTDDFLKIFGLGALADLPSLREASSLERDPGEPDEVIVGDDSLDVDAGCSGPTTAESLTPFSDEESSSLSTPRGLASRITIESISADEYHRVSEESGSTWFRAEVNEPTASTSETPLTEEHSLSDSPSSLCIPATNVEEGE